MSATVTLLPDTYADHLESLFGALVDEYSAFNGWVEHQHQLLVVARERLGDTEADTVSVLELPEEVLAAAHGVFDNVVLGIADMARNETADFHEMRRACAPTDGPVTAWAFMTTFDTVDSDDQPMTLRLINAVDVDGRHYQALRQKDGPLHATEWLTTEQLRERYREQLGQDDLPVINELLAELVEASRVEPANLAALDQLSAALAHTPA